MAENDLYYYPTGTPGSEQHGFYRRLTSEQQEALKAIQKWAVGTDVNIANLGVHTLHPTLTLLRYLRANNFDIEKTTEHIARNIAWRAEHGVDELIKKRPEDILGCSLESLTQYFPHWHCGYDRVGRPVLYKQYGKFEVSKIKSITTVDNIMKYHIWEQEACLQLCVNKVRSCNVHLVPSIYHSTISLYRVLMTFTNTSSSYYPYVLYSTNCVVLMAIVSY
jgi:CRAL/TRIO domain